MCNGRFHVEFRSVYIIPVTLKNSHFVIVIREDVWLSSAFSREHFEQTRHVRFNEYFTHVTQTHGIVTYGISIDKHSIHTNMKCEKRFNNLFVLFSLSKIHLYPYCICSIENDRRNLSVIDFRKEKGKTVLQSC